MRFITPTLPTNATKEDKIFAAISDFTSRILVSVVSESDKYCFKCADGSIHTIDKKVINEFANVQ